MTGFYGKASHARLGLLWLVLISLTAAADETTDELAAPSESGPAGRLETVQVTATRTEQSILEVQEAVSVVSGLDIERQGPEMLAEMLRGVPGAFFQQTTPGQGIPIIRGLKGSQVLHLVDGMRLNNAFFRNAPNQYLGLVDTYATERMEVVRGSAPSLYGADAMGGVVQILTAEPSFDQSEWSAFGDIYGTFNSVDSSVIARAQAAAGHQDTVLSGGLTYQDHGDRRVGGGESIKPTGYKVRAADFKWRQSFSDSAELMLSVQYLEQPSTPRIDELVPGFGQDQPSSEIYEFRPNRREFFHARFRYHSDSRWFSDFEAHLGRQVITDDRLTQDFGETEQTDESNKSTLNGLTLQFNSPWGSKLAGTRELMWGLEYYDDEVSSSRLRTDIETGETRTTRGRFPDDSTMKSAAIFASNAWNWERWSVTAGLRYSWFEIVLPATAEIPETRLEPSDLTGDIHLGYEVRPDLFLVANVGRGFRPPNIFDLGTLGSRPGNRFNVPNPDLKPESVWSYDVGMKFSGERWQIETYLWYSDYQDRITSRFTGETTPEGRFIVISDNLNSAELYGVEAGLRYIASPEWEFYAVANYTRGDETDPAGVTVPGDRIPPLNGRIGWVWNVDDSIRIEPYLDIADRQDRLSPRDVGDPRIDPTGTPGFTTINLLASWQPTDTTTLGLRLLNLTDNNYREHGSGIDAPGRNIGIWGRFRF